MTATPAPLSAAATRDTAAAARDRLTALSRRVATLRPRSAGIPLERTLLVAGGILAPLGLAIILIGWYGVAHTSYLFEQNSYMISGGLLGLALVVAGATLYLSFWVTKRYRSAGAEHRATLAALRMLQEQIEQLTRVAEALTPSGAAPAGPPAGPLAGPPPGASPTGASSGGASPGGASPGGAAPAGPPADPSPADTPTGSSPVVSLPDPSPIGSSPATVSAPITARTTTPRTTPAPRFVASAHGSQFHAPGCSVVAGRQNLREVRPGEGGLTPCRICRPSPGTERRSTSGRHGRSG